MGAGRGQTPDHKQPGALSPSELLKNKCNPVSTLKRKVFSFQKLLFGMFSIFHQNHKLVLFSSPFYDMSLMGNLNPVTMTDGCSWKINKN